MYSSVAASCSLTSILIFLDSSISSSLRLPPVAAVRPGLPGSSLVDQALPQRRASDQDGAELEHIEHVQPHRVELEPGARDGVAHGPHLLLPASLLQRNAMGLDV